MTRSRFAQIPEPVLFDDRLSDAAKAAYAVLDFVIGGRRQRHVSTAFVARTLGVSRRKAWRVVAELVAAGHVTADRGGFGTNNGAANTYRLPLRECAKNDTRVRQKRHASVPKTTHVPEGIPEVSPDLDDPSPRAYGPAPAVSKPVYVDGACTKCGEGVNWHDGLGRCVK